jgi:hypothetical protein
MSGSGRVDGRGQASVSVAVGSTVGWRAGVSLPFPSGQTTSGLTSRLRGERWWGGTPPNNAMQLTKLRAAPVLRTEVPPCAPAGRMDGGTASQLIASVRRLLEGER